MSQGLLAGLVKPTAGSASSIRQVPNEMPGAGSFEAARLLQARLSHIPSSRAAGRLKEYVRIASDPKASTNRLTQLEQVITKNGDERLSVLLNEFKGHIARLSKELDKADSHERQREVNKILCRVTDITALFDGKRPGETRAGSLQRKVIEVAAAAQEAGFTGNNLVTAVAIAMAESSGKPRSRNGSCKGLFQIHTRAHADLCGGKDVYDPITNARLAYVISGGGKNWHPWGVYPIKYKKYLPMARRAVASLADPA